MVASNVQQLSPAVGRPEFLLVEPTWQRTDGAGESFNLEQKVGEWQNGIHASRLQSAVPETLEFVVEDEQM